MICFEVSGMSRTIMRRRHAAGSIMSFLSAPDSALETMYQLVAVGMTEAAELPLRRKRFVCGIPEEFLWKTVARFWKLGAIFDMADLA